MELYPSVAPLPKTPPRERLKEVAPKGCIRRTAYERRAFQTAFKRVEGRSR